jgi:hypothetical protein
MMNRPALIVSGDCCVLILRKEEGSGEFYRLIMNDYNSSKESNISFHYFCLESHLSKHGSSIISFYFIKGLIQCATSSNVGFLKASSFVRILFL